MSFPKKSLSNVSYTRAHRILHWLMAVTFIFIIITALLRQGWMNRHTVADMVLAQAAQDRMAIPKETAVKIGKAVRKPMWDMHIYAGYFLIALYIIRLLVMKIEGPVFKSPFSKKMTASERLKSIIYTVFYVCLGTSLLTGGYIEIVGKINLPVYAVMKGIHVQSLYYALAFIALHLTGLIWAELGADKGIISRMVHGKKV